MRTVSSFIIIMLLSLFLNCKDQDAVSTETLLKIQSELESSGSQDIKSILDKYIPENMQLKFVDENLYYPFALLYGLKHDNNSISSYLLQQAFLSDTNLFKQEALYAYIDNLLKQGRFNELKTLIKEREELLTEDKEFLTEYARGAGIDKLTYLPEKTAYFPLLMDIIGKNRDLMNETAYKRLLDSFCIKSYNKDYFRENIDLLKKATEYSDSSILKSIYYYTRDESENFVSLIPDALDECIYHYEANFIKTMAYKLDVRKNLFYELSLRADRESHFINFLYGIEAVHYRGTAEALPYLKKALAHYDSPGSPNYLIRSKLLFYKIGLNDTRINDIVAYCNDYPNTYMSKALLHTLVKMSIINKKQDFLVPYMSSIDASRMNSLYRSIFYYWMTLLDSNTHWKEKLEADHRLSYGNLTYNSDNVSSYVVQTKDTDQNKPQLTEEGKRGLAKVSYLLQFNLYNEARKVTRGDFADHDKVTIYQAMEKYLLARHRYYDALRLSTKINRIKFGDNFEGIDLERLKKLFPTHYKKQVFYYAEKYNVDPALAFAVIREESHFAKDIQSWASAVGLMQIMPSTRDWLAPKIGLKKADLTNPDHNIHLGIYFLNFLEERYFKETESILASYNAGQGRMLRWKKKYGYYPKQIMYELLPLEEPRHYIRKVMRSYYIYKYLLSLEES